MEIINAYFEGIVFVKIEKKEMFTIYAAAISSSFGDGQKTYAIAFVPSHVSILDKGFLRDLHWQNFQTRTLTNGWKIPNQRWDIRGKLKGLPTPMFNVVERNEARTKYSCETELLEMVLLHDPKKKSIYQYHNRINLLAALITFKCVLNSIDDREQSIPITNYNSGDIRQESFRRHPSTVPISSLSLRAPQRSELYRASELPEDTTYTPRNEGTRYAANSSSSDGYEFNNSMIVGNTGYRTMSLDISVPESIDREDDSRKNHEVIDASFELL